jgi:imidazoleglycerol-phosphate dehydratase
MPVPSLDGNFILPRNNKTTKQHNTTTTKVCHSIIMTPKFTISNVETINLGHANHAISTGIGFFDHMLDQFHSHAQIGVAVTVAGEEGGANRHANVEQSELLSQVGKQLGISIHTLLEDTPIGATSRFCCPLDEALVECVLVRASIGQLKTFTLPPYGIYGKHGRTNIGQLQTSAIHSFVEALAEHSDLQIALTKIRGNNGHHVVESAFKAISRALRNILDGTNVDITEGILFDQLWGSTSASLVDSLSLHRIGRVERATKETSILVDLALDDGATGVIVETGIDVLNEIITTLANHSNISLICKCKGDLYVDDHHSTEDVGIALGQVLTQALGTKAGLNRMWCARARVGKSFVEVTMDLSNRPCMTENLTLCNEEYVVEGQALTTEMLHHFFESLITNAHMTVHILQLEEGDTMKDCAFATAAAFGKALKLCMAVDPRRAGTTASSKGTLNV